ncbi:MAG TPA: nucleotidyl transferase AbiEii/AbiGii toxin family protein [Chitinophagaceae bacterium]|nr:nucleotidyl transferase AbiEii/AbiGii toxin family protein [Chitinophagaceae bacterium]HNM33980.1 nucleotidyl transferase AbiEii/AbiGii toxin family protein [Chitinophagaceae bacterium]
MHKEILDDNQIKLLPLVKEFKRTFYLAGGTAIALHIGHRRSIDFDLFRKAAINHKFVLDKIKLFNYKPIITRRVEEQMNLVIDTVKFTFFQYPFDIDRTVKFENFISLPPLLDLAAMKAYALGRRSKWKDYVDLYFIITQFYAINDVSKRATEIFGDLFSEKQFRAQLCYFEDVDYTEEIEFIYKPIAQTEIKNRLIQLASQF